MTRPPILRLHTEPDELLVDNFAGGGGASTGLEWAFGRSPDIAVNHDPEAIEMHRANHPNTQHFCESVWKVDPVAVCKGRPVGLAWFSPDCTYFSKSRGGKPFRDRKKALRRRGLAWVVSRWAKAVKPRIIMLENVEEFEDWGPLGADGLPDKVQKGFTFRRWVARLRNLGYDVEHRVLKACDFGAPTSRKRLFLLARCDGEAIVWPEPTHGPGRPHPYRTAAECIDWSIPTRSIFDRKKPLAENTLRRIARGIRKYVLEAADPFIVPVSHGGDARVHSIHDPLRTVTASSRSTHSVIIPTLIQTSWGERKGQKPRVPGLHKPLGTIMSQGGKHALVAALLTKHNGGHEGPGQSPARPMPTLTAKNSKSLTTALLVKFRGGKKDHQVTAQQLDLPLGTITASGFHFAEVRAFLIKYYGTDQDPRLGAPLQTVTTKHRFALVTVHGVDYYIADIHMRMLEPRELSNATGFDEDYVIAPQYKGKKLTKTAQVRMIGNAVSPYMSLALAAANYKPRRRTERRAA